MAYARDVCVAQKQKQVPQNSGEENTTTIPAQPRRTSPPLWRGESRSHSTLFLQCDDAGWDARMMQCLSPLRAQ
jgi:hypothetical protein